MKPRLILLAIVLCCGVIGIKDEIAQVRMSHGVKLDRQLGDPDEPCLAAGMRSTRSFSDTAKRWSGSWIAGAVAPYYRPLTSYVFWAEYIAFGEHGFAGFKAVMLALHLCVLALAVLFLNDLLGAYTSAAACALWGVGATGWLGLMTPWYALQHWKDTPEMLVALPYLGCLWCVLRYSRTEHKAWAAGAIAVMVMALLFKEMAYSLPLTTIAVLWREKMAEKHMSLIVATLVLAAVFFGLRTFFLSGLGMTYGDVGINQLYAYRWIRALAGDYGLMAVKSGGIGILAIIGIATIIGYRMKTNRDWLFALLMVTLLFLPLTAWQVTAHATYLVSIFTAVWLVYLLQDIAMQSLPNLARATTQRPALIDARSDILREDVDSI
jgi:hypothetical protein